MKNKKLTWNRQIAMLYVPDLHYDLAFHLNGPISTFNIKKLQQVRKCQIQCTFWADKKDRTSFVSMCGTEYTQ